jgi:hypothetical protein
MMVSKYADEINKAIDNVLKDGNVEQLLRDYLSDTDRNYIQKYAETKITIISANLTLIASLASIVFFCAAVIMSIMLTKGSGNDFFFDSRYTASLITLMIIVFYFLISEKSPKQKKIKIFEKIIIAIEDEKLTSQISSEVDIPPTE